MQKQDAGNAQPKPATAGPAAAEGNYAAGTGPSPRSSAATGALRVAQPALGRRLPSGEPLLQTGKADSCTSDLHLLQATMQGLNTHVVARFAMTVTAAHRMQGAAGAVRQVNSRNLWQLSTSRWTKQCPVSHGSHLSVSGG